VTGGLRVAQTGNPARPVWLDAPSLGTSPPPHYTPK
jgi:hypothetical protein